MKISAIGNSDVIKFEPENTYDAYRLGFLVGRSGDGDYGITIKSNKGGKIVAMLSIRCTVDDLVKRLIKRVCNER